MVPIVLTIVDGNGLVWTGSALLSEELLHDGRLRRSILDIPEPIKLHELKVVTDYGDTT